MLKSIYIDNYALIEQIEIELRNGLTIITGETGAGKTILLGALGLLLGKRADTSILKDKERKCVVEGTFGIEDYGLEPFFRSNELDFFPETIIRREIGANGKSRAFINDSPVTLDVVQELALRLVDIHSQHQNLALNNESYIRWIIDAYTGITDTVNEYRTMFLDFQKIQQEFVRLRELYLNEKQNLEYLTHQYNELLAAELKNGELAGLEEKAAMLDHAEEIKSAFKESIQILGEEDTGAITGLKHVADILSRIGKHYTPAGELIKRMEETYIELKDIYSEIESHFNSVDFDSDAAIRINERIDLLNTLLNKYRVQSVEKLIDIRDSLDKKLQQLSLGDFELEKLAKTLEEKKNLVSNGANEISEARKGVFPEFEKQIKQLLQLLGMKNADFTVVHEPTGLCDSGVDRIQFFFSANSNMRQQNIAKIASGGELSRLMLAIKYLISGTSGLPTIVFDEIDSGVSGEIADKVGNLIREMSKGMQVINITHLPQVASKGENHILVFKQVVDGTTKTLIKNLDKGERLFEIARMLSGDSVTDAAIENAKVLLGR